MNLWEERAARNEALFREVNEQARTLSGHQREGRGEAGFICECSDDGCVERLLLPLDVYEAVRADSRQFVVVPGHEGDVEHVVERAADYVIVKKDGAAGRIADRTDPRD
jgi:hypothetical protein